MRLPFSNHFTTKLRSVVATATATAFLFTTVATPVVEANFWQERREAAQRANGKGDLYAQLPGSLRVENALPAIQGALGQALSAPKLGEISAAVAASVRASDIPAWLRHLPSVNGEIRRVSLAKNAEKSPAVVLIQDVHDIPSAQKNIAQILSHIDTAAKGQEVLIGVEGAMGAFGIAPYRGLREFEGHKITCDILLDSHLIAAPEYHGFQSEKEPKLWGVETPADYIENVEAYRASRPLAEDVETKLANADRALEKKAEGLSPALLKVETAVRSYAAGKLPFADYIRALSEQVSLKEQGAETAKLVRALDMERRLDFRQVERERGVLVETLVNKLDKKSIESLVESSLAYRAGRKTYGAYYSELKTLASGKGVNWQNYPAFERYVDYVLISESIDKFALFDQVEGLKTQAIQATARTDAERDYAALAEDVRLLTRLVRHEFGPAEWKHYQARRLDLAQLEGRLSRALGDQVPAPTGDQLAVFERFYRAADKRNHSLTDNLLDKAKEKDSKVLALIAGGFHTPAIEALLEKAGLSVITVTPRVEEIPAGSNYLDFFTAKHIPLEEMFAGERLYLAPTHGLASVPGVKGDASRSSARVGQGFAALLLALGLLTSSPLQVESIRQDLQVICPTEWVTVPDGYVATAHDAVEGSLRLAAAKDEASLRAVAKQSGATKASTLWTGEGGKIAVLSGERISPFDTISNGLFAAFGLLPFSNLKTTARKSLKWAGRVMGRLTNLLSRAAARFSAVVEKIKNWTTSRVLSLGATMRSWWVTDPLRDVIDRGVAYWEGRIKTGPVMQKFRPSRQADIPFVADMDPSRKRALVERGLSEYQQGTGIVGVLAAGAASRMNTDDSPPYVLAMLERMFGKGEKTTILSKAAVPVAEREGRVYTFLGMFMTNLARMENAVSRASAGRAKPNRVSILTTDEYKDELAMELASQANYGVQGPILTPRQSLGEQYVSTPADVDKLMSKLGDDYETARDLSISVETRLKVGDRSAVILPNEKAPLGHGEYFHQMVESGDLLDHIESGVKWMYIRNIDNSAALIDEDFLAMLGLFLEDDLDFLAEVSPREEGMKGGALIVSDKGQKILTEGPSFQATWDRVVEGLVAEGFRPVSNEREKRKAVADVFSREKEMRVQPSRMDFEGGRFANEEEAWKAVSQGHVEPFINALTQKVIFVRHVHPESTYWFNNASGFFRPKYLYYIYRKGPKQTYDQFVRELRRARSSVSRRNAIAARGRSRFPTLVDPKPAKTQAAGATKFETNMWQATQVAAEAGARLGAAGVYSIKNLLGMADDDKATAKGHLRFLATKQWKGPAESYESNRDYVEGILDRILTGKLFPDDIQLPPFETRSPPSSGWRNLFPVVGGAVLLSLFSPDLFAQTVGAMAGTAGFWDLAMSEAGMAAGVFGLAALLVTLNRGPDAFKRPLFWGLVAALVFFSMSALAWPAQAVTAGAAGLAMLAPAALKSGSEDISTLEIEVVPSFNALNSTERFAQLAVALAPWGAVYETAEESGRVNVDLSSNILSVNWNKAQSRVEITLKGATPALESQIRNALARENIIPKSAEAFRVAISAQWASLGFLGFASSLFPWAQLNWIMDPWGMMVYRRKKPTGDDSNSGAKLKSPAAVAVLAFSILFLLGGLLLPGSALAGEAVLAAVPQANQAGKLFEVMGITVGGALLAAVWYMVFKSGLNYSQLSDSVGEFSGWLKKLLERFSVPGRSAETGKTLYEIAEKPDFDGIIPVIQPQLRGLQTLPIGWPTSGYTPMINAHLEGIPEDRQALELKAHYLADEARRLVDEVGNSTEARLKTPEGSFEVALRLARAMELMERAQATWSLTDDYSDRIGAFGFRLFRRTYTDDRRVRNAWDAVRSVLARGIRGDVGGVREVRELSGMEFRVLDDASSDEDIRDALRSWERSNSGSSTKETRFLAFAIGSARNRIEESADLNKLYNQAKAIAGSASGNKFLLAQDGDAGSITYYNEQAVRVFDAGAALRSVNLAVPSKLAMVVPFHSQTIFTGTADNGKALVLELWDLILPGLVIQRVSDIDTNLKVLRLALQSA